jgi:glycosyltransferase involved in cell wall biosynthesis
MELSVILCTFNRACNLKDCVEHVSNQQGMDGVDWELLIVNNNSTDRTEEIARELIDKHTINIRYVLESEQGLSYARNRGIASTDSQYIVFIDDDILVEPKWLRAIYSTFKGFDSDAVGGRIWLKSPSKLPKWITEEMRSYLGHLDFGDVPLRVDGHIKKMFGGNMGFDRRIFEQVGLFDVRRGRRGEGLKWRELFKGEEPDLFHRIADASGRIDYSPEAIVYHKILPHQLKRQFFRVLEFSNGYQEIKLGNNCCTRLFLGIPLFMFRAMCKEMIEYFRQILICGPDRAFRQQLKVASSLGRMVAFYEKNLSKTL